MRDDRIHKDGPVQKSEDVSPPPVTAPTPESQVPTASAPAPAGPQPSVPWRIGPYRLVRLVGEGGMGRVYEAEQERPLRRRVALKLVRWGLDSREVLARFEMERQTIALMSHPNVARVFDAGTTEQGFPYFVMELVPGPPLTDYCDAERLTIEQRLRLFLQVCEAIQHAHQKGIIHRDIKPSNVLVSVADDPPTPKVIDFGIARAIARQPDETVILTQVGQHVGTPGYMSPEQLQSAEGDIDTRTDVYGLGVLLYVLLTGLLPFDLADCPGRNLEELRRRIREEDPLRPSDRVRRAGEPAMRAAESRRSDPATLARRLQGDLDWITLKALEKDRERRYGTASELAADIVRHLSDEPVIASPPSTAYRMRKFARRHRAGVTASAVAFLALSLGGLGTTAGLVRSQRAEAQAKVEAETARQVLEFMISLFEVNNPSQEKANTITARQILDQGAGQIRRGLGQQPVIKARLMDSMGRVYQSLGLYEQADTLLHEALAIQASVPGPQRPELARSTADLGSLRLVQGRLAEAHAMLRRALAAQERTLGPGALETGWTLYLLSIAQGRQGQREAAIASLTRAQKIFSSKLGPEDVKVAWCQNDLGNLLNSAGRKPEAVQCYLRSLRIKEKALGPDHWDVAVSMNNVGMILMDQGRYDEAEPYIRRAVQLTERILGPDHLQTATCRVHLGELTWRRGDVAGGRKILHQVLATLERIQTPAGPDLATCLHTLAYLEQGDGNQREAERLYRRALAMRESLLDPADPELADTRSRLVALLRRSGRDEEATDLEARGTVSRSVSTKPAQD